MKKILSVLLFVLIIPTAAWADMGQIHASGVHVAEDSQKAIILHNLEEEILILGTDLRAEKQTGIIRFIPFPSEPSVALAEGDPFKATAELIAKHHLAFVYQTKGNGADVRDVEILFNKKMGAHDVTVVKINQVSTFREWVNNFFKTKGLPAKEAYPEIESVAENYVKRGIIYFVFDFVELTPEVRFVEPMAYQFKSKKLYYPLVTSNTFGGEGGIEISLFSPRTACHPLESNYNGCMGLPNLYASTSAKVTLEDVNTVYPQAADFFKGQTVYLQYLRFFGQYQFENDLIFDLRQGFDRAFYAKEFVKDKPSLRMELTPEKK